MQSGVGAQFKTVAWVAGGTAATVGALGLLAWLLGVPALLSVAPGLTVLNPLAALSLLIAALALGLQVKPSPRRRPWALALAAVLVGIGLAVVSDAWLGTGFGLDQAFLREALLRHTAPVHVAVSSAIALVFLGAALLDLDSHPDAAWRPAEVLAMASGLISLHSLLAYAYLVLALIDPAVRPPALLTALGIFALSLGVLCARADLGAMQHVASPYQGGRTLRRLFPAWLALPFALAFAHGLARRTIGLEAVIVPQVELIVLAIGLTYWAGAALNREDEARTQLAAARADQDRIALELATRDLGERRRHEALMQAEKGVLELIGRGADLRETLEAITRLVEEQTECVLASILLVDEAGYVHLGAGGSLPAAFNRAVDGQPIGPRAGSCGTAAYLKRTVTTPDIATDPLWEDYRAVALAAGLGASWSTPLFARDGRVVGTLAHYYRQAQDPTPRDWELTEVARHLAEIAIARQQADQALRQANDELERRVVERTEALRLSEARLRAIVEHTSDAIYIKDPENRFLLINRAGAAYLGREVAQVIGKRSRDVMDAASAEAIERHDRHIYEHGSVQTVEEPLLVDGEPRVFLSTKFPYRSDEGEVLGLVGISRDVTESKRAETQLRNNERMLTEAQSLAHMGSWEWDMRENQVRWSDELYRIYGLKPQEFGATFEAFLGQIRADERERVKQVVMGAAATHTPYAIEEHIIRPSGEERVLASSGRVEVDDAGQAARMWGICLDITERKRVEAEVIELNATLERRIADRTRQLEAANRELEAFSYSVSHDLRAPLRSIAGFSQALLEDYEARLDETGQDYLRRVRAASQRMAQLIDDILQLSRLTRGELRWAPVDLSALAREVAAGVRQAEPTRDVTFVIADGLTATGDARLLQAALENLIGNAWKFTGKHAHARIEVGARDQGGERVFFVRDDGAGFDMAHVDKLFAPFSRLHTAEEFPGTGIGLATVQRVVHRHGGRIWAEGAVERGATIYFTLGEGRRP